MVDAEQIKGELRQAVQDLSSRGLKLAAKWTAELLVATKPEQTDGVANASSPASASSSAPSALGGASSLMPHTVTATVESDEFVLAKTFFDMGEYSRAAELLRPGIGAARPATTFLYAYSRYLGGEKRREEEMLERADTLERCPVVNKELVGLQAELLPLWRAHALDGFGLYAFGLVLKKLGCVGGKSGSSSSGGDGPRVSSEPHARGVLLQSVAAYPWNWAAWLDLAELHTQPTPTVPAPNALPAVGGADGSSAGCEGTGT